ncbi:MAG: ABC-2 transporter permease, partial [Lachnospiraceae bacterium]|nr:ABC-2 transporter permease [Lachnospiraceae bacterium]
MSGLFVKDLALLMQRRSSMLILMVVGAVMGFSMDGSFVVGYITMLTAILTLGTITYDEFDNGYPFLLTLPITRKLYVQSKYLFSAVLGLVGWAFAIVVYVACSFARSIHLTVEDLLGALIFIPFFLLIIAVMMPLQLKYGAEGSRIVMAIIAGVIAIIGFFGMKVFPEGLRMPEFVQNLSVGGVIAIA